MVSHQSHGDGSYILHYCRVNVLVSSTSSKKMNLSNHVGDSKVISFLMSSYLIGVVTPSRRMENEEKEEPIG